MKLKSPSRTACSLALGSVLLVASTIFAQQLGAPSAEDSTTVKLVCNMVSRYHINKAAVNDEVSPRLLNRFIEMLDPQKLYFTAGDIEEFEASRLLLDDQLQEGNVSFAYNVFNRYIDRMDERITYAHKMVDVDHDFTVDEEMPTDGKSQVWSPTIEDMNDRWRRRVKFDTLNLRLDGKTEPAAIRDRLHKRYNTLLRSIQETEPNEILEMYLSALTHCFDPHSSYMSPESMEEFRIQMQLSLDGIGAALRSEDGTTFVADIVKGGAADKDGRLKVGDKITAVAQETGEFVDIIEMKLSKVVRMIRGKRGSKVRLQVARADNNETEVYELVRQKIELDDSAVKGQILDAQDWTGRKARIGVINVPSFYRDFNGAEQGVDDFKSTARDLQNVLADFRRQGGVDAIIVDLRFNGGGALSEAIEVTGLFIDQGPVVQVKEPGSTVKVYSDDVPGAFNEPLVVVCNRMSASASEIFAGAIKDYRRGIVVGDSTTHGKGTVQNLMPVSSQMFQFFNRKDRGSLKLTINQFYRVNGDSTQKDGVTSDIVLPSLIDHMDIGESSLDNALAFDRIDPAEYESLAYVNKDVLARLQKQSAQRIAASKDFADIQADINRYLERKKRKSITLNEEKLKQERERDKKEEEADSEEENRKNDGPVLPDTPYNRELLSITVDYLESIRSAATAKR